MAERAVQMVKNGLLAWKESTFHMDFTEIHLQKILLHHRIATSARGKSPAEIIFGRQLRVPIMSTLQQGDPIWYRPQTGSATEQASYLMTSGQNTSWVINNDQLMLASNNQIAPSSKDSEVASQLEEQEITPQTDHGAPMVHSSPVLSPGGLGNGTQEKWQPLPSVHQSDRIKSYPERCGFD